MLTLLAETMGDGRWHIGIGDPTIYGWVTTAAYFAAAALCLLAWRRERWAADIAPVRLYPRFWLALGVAMTALGFNKQLDLQTLFTQIGRDVAKSQGWYSDRRSVQFVFIAALAGAGLSTIAIAAWAIRGKFRRYRLAIIGITYLAAFVVIRAASFHHMDRFLYSIPVIGPGMNRILELGGICTVALAAWKGSKVEG